MNNYLKYLSEVLGVQSAMLQDLDQEKQAAHTASKSFFHTQQGPFVPSEIKYFELVFINIVTQTKESFFNPATFDLAHKMRSAMKLRNLQVIEFDCSLDDRSLLPTELAKVCESKIVIVYSSFPKDIGELIFKGQGKWIETYSPAYLLEDPAAKKIVWNDLQKVMKELGV